MSNPFKVKGRYMLFKDIGGPFKVGLAASDTIAGPYTQVPNWTTPLIWDAVGTNGVSHRLHTLFQERVWGSG